MQGMPVTTRAADGRSRLTARRRTHLRTQRDSMQVDQTWLHHLFSCAPEEMSCRSIRQGCIISSVPGRQTHAPLSCWTTARRRAQP